VVVELNVLVFAGEDVVVVGFNSVSNPPKAKGAAVIQLLFPYQLVVRKGK
jgi:hypothetical protein